MPSMRCSAFVIDSKTKHKRQCKLYSHVHGLCYKHASNIRNNAAIIIQRIWIGFHTRTKLKNIYYKLPKELQMNIVRYIREDHYIEKKWIPSVIKVYKNRLHRYIVMTDELHEKREANEINALDYSYGLDDLFTLRDEVHSKLDMFLDD
jgi:hypothetical protein